MLRNFDESSIDDMIEILSKARADHPHERRLTPDEAREYTVLDPDFDSEGSWFAILEGEAVGFGFVLVESNRIKAGKDDAYVDIDVVPEHRGKGVEQKLLDKSLDYLRSRNVGGALSRCPVMDGWKRSLLTSHSFEEVYRVYVLVRRGRAEVQDALPPPGFQLERRSLRECSNDDITKIVDVFNDSFRDHFNFAPERPERFINARDCRDDPTILTLAWRMGEITGFCLSEESLTFNQEKGERTGWVDILGVRPRFRRIGLGKALLSDGMRWILDRGLDTIYLGVFAKNEMALGLYRPFGFLNDTESVWYSKNIPKDATDPSSHALDKSRDSGA